jgi:hypothetical protein
MHFRKRTSGNALDADGRRPLRFPERRVSYEFVGGAHATAAYIGF